MHPRQMIAIFFKPKKKRFFFYVWNTTNCIGTIKSLALSFLELNIPFLLQMIAEKQYY
jgi:hypothetical protein